jgi:uncharacterized protein YecT (DUF1311 family)
MKDGKKKFLPILAMGLFYAGTALAQDPKDPIDKQLDTCLNTPAASSTAGQSACLSSTALAWDRELNKVYGKLMRTLDAASQTSLRSSQKQWLSFRDAEKRFQALWSNSQGSLAIVSIAQTNVDILRNRVLTLRGYLQGNNP